MSYRLTALLVAGLALLGCSSKASPLRPSSLVLASEKVRPKTQTGQVYLVVLDQAELRAAWTRFGFRRAVPTDVDFAGDSVLLAGTGEGSNCPKVPTDVRIAHRPPEVTVVVKTKERLCNKDFTPRSFAVRIPHDVAAAADLKIRITGTPRDSTRLTP
jgi:hypothetical protein